MRDRDISPIRNMGVTTKKNGVSEPRIKGCFFRWMQNNMCDTQ
jgi:hypothetical protein